MSEFSYIDIFATKGFEYLIVIGYLDNVPCPIPLRVDGEEPASEGTTIVHSGGSRFSSQATASFRESVRSRTWSAKCHRGTVVPTIRSAAATLRRRVAVGPHERRDAHRTIHP